MYKIIYLRYPSNFNQIITAHPTHYTPADRSIPFVTSSPGHDDPGDQSPGDTGHTDRTDRERLQPEHHDHQEPTTITDEHQSQPMSKDDEEPYKNQNGAPVKSERPMDVEHKEQTYQEDANFIGQEQNYEATQMQYQPEYQNNYEEPTYANEQYENYEQYQQYADPNAQYNEEQYNNIAEVNYQPEQNYEQSYENTAEAPQEQYYPESNDTNPSDAPTKMAEEHQS